MDASDKVDRLVLQLFWVAVGSITLSATAVTWSISRGKALEDKVERLDDSYDYLSVRYTNLMAYLEARGIEVPDE